jgi:hypothetical protein
MSVRVRSRQVQDRNRLWAVTLRPALLVALLLLGPLAVEPLDR